MKRFLFLPIILALGLLCACNEEDNSNQPDGDWSVPADGDSEWSWTELDLPIEAPSGPRLPDCLSGDSPEGCAQAPQLSSCPAGVTAFGCPTPPALENWNCPTSWRSVALFSNENGEADPPQELSGVTACQPPSAPTDCPADQRAQLGETVCVPIGSACPSGDFPEPPANTDGTVRYVRQGSTNGNGTQAAPYASIAQAISAAAAGDVILIGPGTYVDLLQIDKPLTLIGACVAKTRLKVPQGNGDLDTAAIHIQEASVTLKNLALMGQQNGLTIKGESAVVTASGLLIEDASGSGIRISSGVLRLSGSRIANSISSYAGGTGQGITALDGATLTISDSVLEGNRDAAISLRGQRGDIPSSATLNNVLLRNTHKGAASYSGFGLALYDGAQARLSAVWLDRNHGAGILATAATPGLLPYLELTDVAVTDTQPNESDEYGRGLHADGGANISAQRLLLSGNHEIGLYLSDVGSSLDATDLWIVDSLPSPNGDLSSALWLQSGAQATIKRGVIDRAGGVGVFATSVASSTATQLTFSDLVVRNTLENSNGRPDSGIQLQAGATLSLTRALLIGNRDSGLLCLGSEQSGPTLAQLTDVTVRDTWSADYSSNGRGIWVQQGARVELSRGLIANNRMAGLYVFDEYDDMPIHEPSTLIASDVVVCDTAPNPGGKGGHGLNIENGGTVELSRVRFESNTELGILLSNTGVALASMLTAEDLSVLDTQANAEGDYGRGLEVQDGSVASVTRSVFDNNRDIAVFASSYQSLSQTELTLDQTLIRNTQLNKLGGFGRGLAVQHGALAEVHQLRLSDNRDHAIFAYGNRKEQQQEYQTYLELYDVLVEDTTSNAAGRFGRGLTLRGEGRVIVERGRFSRNQEVGVMVRGLEKPEEGEDTRQPSTIDLTDVIIEDTRFATCGEEEDGTCIVNGVNYASGNGLVVISDGRATLQSFIIFGSDMAGMQIEQDGIVQANTGIITGNRIGMNINDPSYDMTQLQDEVYSYGNSEEDLSQAAIPLPDTADAGGHE